MRILVLYAHPRSDSFHAALHRTAVDRLTAAGHEVDDCDLYGEGFDPVLSADGRGRYFDTERNTADVQPYVDRLLAAQGIVFCFPVWCFGPPAILKGYMDRVMVPGVSFRMDDTGTLRPNLQHIRSVAAVVTYGRSRWEAMYLGDPPRKIITRYFKWFVAPGTRIAYLAQYNLHKVEGPRLQRFHNRVARHMDGFGG